MKYLVTIRETKQNRRNVAEIMAFFSQILFAKSEYYVLKLIYRNPLTMETSYYSPHLETHQRPLPTGLLSTNSS